MTTGDSMPTFSSCSPSWAVALRPCTYRPAGSTADGFRLQARRERRRLGGGAAGRAASELRRPWRELYTRRSVLYRRRKAARQVACAG